MFGEPPKHRKILRKAKGIFFWLFPIILIALFAGAVIAGLIILGEWGFWG